MASDLNKLQIRAKVLSTLSELKTDNTITHAKFKEYIEALKEIKDKEDIFDILAKELSKIKEPYITAVKNILIEVIPSDMLQEKILNLLTSTKLPDQGKYQLIQVLKDVGGKVDYENFLNYFENPDSIIDYDTEKLLEFALVNPETQIDFLDFLTAIADTDKTILINSLNDEYQGENLANILTPVLYTDMSSEVIKRVIEIIAETKSSLAIEPIKYVMEQTEDETLSAFCKKSLNILKIAGATEQKADIFYKMTLSKSKINKCYTTLPDGHDNQGILITRKKQDDTYQIFAVVVSSTFGVIDSFGFNSIGPNEIDRIISSFYKNKEKLEITPEYCKTLINKAVNITRIFKESYPYEFICWNNLTRDIDEFETSLDNIVKDKIEPIKLTSKEMKAIYNKEYFDKWFIGTEDDLALKEVIQSIYKNDNIDIQTIDALVNESFNKIWNETSISQLENRLINTAYLAIEANKKQDAQTIYSILSNEQFKNKLMLNIIKKSIYEYFLVQRQNIKDTKESTNIFKLKQKKEEKTDIKKFEEIIKIIENNWAD